MEVVDLIKGFGLELSEEQETQIKQSIGKEYVLRSDFNNKAAELKTANGKIKDLEKRDFSSIESERDDYKGKYDGLIKEKSDETKKAKFFEKLGDAKDKDYLLYKFGGLDKLEADDKGEIKDLDTIVKTIQTENPTYFEKTPFVVSKTDGPDNNASSETESANTALKNLI